MDVFTPRESTPKARSRASLIRPRLAALLAGAGLVSACGGPAGQAALAPTHIGSPITTPVASAAAPSATASASPTAGIDSKYCDPVDTPIPQGTGAQLTPTEIYWWQMQATMVPACSEIEGDPPPIQTKNLTGGLMSDAALATWVAADNETWTLTEWGTAAWTRAVYSVPRRPDAVRS